MSGFCQQAEEGVPPPLEESQLRKGFYQSSSVLIPCLQELKNTLEWNIPMGITPPANLTVEQSIFAHEMLNNASEQERCYKDNPESKDDKSPTPVFYYYNRSLVTHLTVDLTTQVWSATVVTSPSGFQITSTASAC